MERSRGPPEEEEEEELTGRGNGRLYPPALEEIDGGHLEEGEEAEMDNIANGEADFAVTTERRPSPAAVLAEEAEDSPPPLRTVEIPVIRFNEVVTARPNMCAGSYSSLPRPLSRHRNISRSLVPKMRRMFEKARSCDPDMPPPPSSTVPGDCEGDRLSPPPPPYLRRATVAQDGTESTRSSFVLLGAAAAGGPHAAGSSSSPEGSSLTLSEGGAAGGGSPGPTDRKSRGFVNKCVTKVKSFMGKSQDRL
jgi:hypothetical protein